MPILYDITFMMLGLHVLYMLLVCAQKSRYFAFTEATATEMVMPTTFLRALVLLWDARDSFL